MSDDVAQIHADSSGTLDTLNSMYVPIVFVPGVMGSRLKMASAQLTWDPDDGPGMLAWLSLQLTGRCSPRAKRVGLSPSSSAATVLSAFSSSLNPFADSKVAPLVQLYNDQNAANPNPPPVDVYYARDRGWGGVAWNFYGPILLQLESVFNRAGNHPVYAFGYDWRDSNIASGKNLGAFITNLLSATSGIAQDVLVVTHSMGGLVLRGALLNDPTLDAKIRGVIHTVQPSNGAVVCYRRFFTGACSLDVTATFNVPDQFLTNVMGRSPEEYGYLLSGAPGPLQLLPNHIFQTDPWLECPSGPLDLGQIYDIYAQYAWPGLQGPVQAGQSIYGSDDENTNNTVVNSLLSNLQVAAEFHTNAATTAHRNTLALYSMGRTTDDHVRFLSAYPADPTSPWVAPKWHDLPQDVDLLHCGSGDGTVPSVSAQCPDLALSMPAEPAQEALEHSAVFNSEIFRNRTAELVATLLSVPPGGTLSAPLP